MFEIVFIISESDRCKILDIVILEVNKKGSLT
jgi:hypothetical protein